MARPKPSQPASEVSLTAAAIDVRVEAVDDLALGHGVLGFDEVPNPCADRALIVGAPVAHVVEGAGSLGSGDQGGAFGVDEGRKATQVVRHAEHSTAGTQFPARRAAVPPKLIAWAREEAEGRGRR